MLNYFCSKCGGKNLYQFQKPKFCSHCGLSFSTSTALPPQNAAVVKSNQFEVNISGNKKINQNLNIVEDDNEDFEQPVQDYSSLRGLDVNIEQYNNNNGVKLGDLVSDDTPQKQIQANKKRPKPRGRKKIAKSLPESFTSEAKMSGRNYNIPELGDSEE